MDFLRKCQLLSLEKELNSKKEKMNKNVREKDNRIYLKRIKKLKN